MRARIEPRIPTPHDLDIERSVGQITGIDVGDFKLTAWRRLDIRSNIADLVVIEVQPGDRVIRPRLNRLLLDRQRTKVSVELDNPITLRIMHVIRKHRSTLLLRIRTLELLRQIVPVENIVAKNQRRRIIANEVAPNDERL